MSADNPDARFNRKIKRKRKCQIVLVAVGDWGTRITLRLH